MLEAGIPLADSVHSLSEQTQNPVASISLRAVAVDLENGYKFSDAVKKHPKVFNTVFVSVVAAGEASGKLDVALGMLADELERDYSFRSRVLGALLYPAFIIVAMFVVGIIMVTRIVPALEGVFKEANVTLPWTTKTVVFLTNSIIHGWWIYLLIFAAVIYLLGRYLSTSEGKRETSILMMKIPVISNLILNMEMSRMTRILGIMIQAGVPIISAIESVALVLDSIVYREALVSVARNVERGAPISQTMIKYKEFPVAVTEMVAAGERTGKLEEVLGRLADFYERQTDQSIRNLTSMVEPVIFVIVGLGVAFIVFSIIVPIYNLSSVM
jgi:type II secretory pathway component PulF